MSVALFVGIFSNGITWHDRSVMDGAAVLTISDVPGLFGDLQPSPDLEGEYQYRPAARMSLLLDSMIFQTRPDWRRVVNILLHYLAVILFYQVVLNAFGDIRTALFSSMLFAIHPIAVEPVNSLMAREGIICAIFIMASLLALQHARAGRSGRIRWGIVALCSFALAVLTIEAALVLSVFLVVLVFISRGDTLKASAPASVAFLLAAAAYFYLRVSLHGDETLNEFLRPVFWESGVPAVVLASAYKYVTLLFLPFSLGVGYSISPVDMSSFQGLVAVSAAAGLLFFAILPWSSGPLRASCLWIMVFFLPFASYLPYASLPISDRYLYLALPGVCLLLGWLVSALMVHNRYFGSLLLAMALVFLGANTYRQNVVWTNDFTLWENAVEVSPSSAYANYNLGRVHDEIGARIQAEAHYDRALELDPGYATAHFGLGNLYRREEKFEPALRNFRMALLLSPEKTWMNLNLGDVYMDMSKWDNAIESYARYLEQYPDDADSHHRIAVAYEEKGAYESSMDHFNKSLSAWPGNAKARYDYSRLLLKVSDTETASHELKLALLIKPDYSEARKLLNRINAPAIR